MIDLEEMTIGHDADLAAEAIGWTVVALDCDGVVMAFGFYADPVTACARAGRLTAEIDPDEDDPAFRYEVHSIQPSTP